MRIQSVKKKYKIKKERYQASLWGDILEYKGKYYSLTGSRIPYLRNKAVDDRFFILTLFAIAYEIEAAGAYDPDEIMDVQLAVGLLNEAVCFPQAYAASVPLFGKLCERMIDLRSPSRRGQRKKLRKSEDIRIDDAEAVLGEDKRPPVHRGCCHRANRSVRIPARWQS